jgi:hypothetical protein
MLAQLIASAIAGAFANAAAGANAALLCRRSIRMQPMAKGSMREQRAAGRSVRVQLRVAGASMAPTESMARIDAIALDTRYADTEFVARQIKSHREAIALYQRNAHAPDAQLRFFAQEILPQLQEHLAMLESLKTDSSRGRR